jgi:hypothetical protein
MRILAIAALLVVSFSCPAAWSLKSEPFSALVVGVAVDPTGQTWEYTLKNTSSSPDYSIWLFQIDTEVENYVVSAKSPAGWMVNTDPQTPNLVTWLYGSGSLKAGDELTGFRASFQSRPLRQGWTVIFDNASLPGDTPVAYGEVITPEPGALLALLAGIVALKGAVIRKRD